MAPLDSGKERLRSDVWRSVGLTRGAAHGLGMGSYVVSLSNLRDAFKLSDRCVRCIDERTPGGVHLAASGLLLSAEQVEQFVAAAGGEGLTYHDDCGAARLWAEQHGCQASEAQERAREAIEALAAKLGLPCREAALAGDLGLHGAVAIYYDGTGVLDPSRAAGLPRGFVVSRRHLDSDPGYALLEVRLAVELALSEFGFAELFAEGAPLRLIPVGDPEDDRFSLDRLTQELQALDLPDPVRVIIDGFTAPEPLLPPRPAR